MRGALLSVRVIGQCHSSDLARRYRCTERTYGRQGRQQGEGRASGADSIWSCRAWFRGGRFRSGHQCHLRGRRGERLFK